MSNNLWSRLNHAEIVGALSALFIFMGALLPWASFGSFSMIGMEGDGIVTFIFSILAFGLIYYGVQKSKRRTSSVALNLLGILTVLIAVFDFDYFAGTAELVQIGVGLYLTVIGGFGLIISGFWNVKIKNVETLAKIPLSFGKKIILYFIALIFILLSISFLFYGISESEKGLSHAFGAVFWIAVFFFSAIIIIVYVKSRNKIITYDKNSEPVDEYKKEKIDQDVNYIPHKDDKLSIKANGNMNENEAVKALKLRYAKGEITKKEYEQIKKDIER